MIARLSVPALPTSKGERQLPQAVQITGGGLIGFGLILFIAANWAPLGTLGQFTVIGTAYGLAALIAAFYPTLRVSGLLVAFAATGAMLSLVGITYQTGADPWQLFALWAALSLPLVLAARHDVTWSAWILVAATALPLWLFAVTGRAWGGAATLPTLVTWLLAAGLAALVSPWSGLVRWTGSTRWAFRLAAITFLILVTTRGLLALWSKDAFGLYFLSLLLVAMIIAALLVVKPLDLSLLALSALAADTLLISALWRAFINTRTEVVSSLLIGVCSAGIVIATVNALRRVTDGRALEFMPEHMRARLESAIPSDLPRWPTILVSALGAIMAAIPLQLFYWMVLGKVLLTGGGGFVLGPLTMLAGTYATRRGRPLGVAQLIGLILILTGLGVFSWALFQHVSLKTAAALLTLLAVAGAIFIRVRWLAVLFGAAAASTTVVVGLPQWSAFAKLAPLAVRDHLLLVVLLIAATGAIAVLLSAPSENQDDAERSGRAHAFATGWFVAALLITIALAGPTFLLGAAWSTRSVSTLTPIAESLTPTFARIAAVVVAGLALVFGSARGSGKASMTARMTATAALMFAYIVPPFAIAIAGFVVFRIVDRQSGVALAALVGLWCLGSWYYSVGMTLDMKAAILVASGLLLTVVATFDGARVSTDQSSQAAPLSQADGSWPALQAAGLIATSVLLTALSVTTSISSNEAIRRDGRRVHVALAPVDPRSLMQGDFMALAFVLPPIGRAEQSAPRLQAIARVDAHNIATVTRIGRTPQKPLHGEIVIDLTYKGRWTIASDAYFFTEGQGTRFETARFGTFRVLPDGRVSLLGLVDKDLKELK